MTGASDASLTQDTAQDGVYCALIDTSMYNYSSTHQYAATLTGIVGTPQRITSPTVSNTGVFDGSDTTFSSVSGTSVEALVLYRQNAGANTTWRLIVYLDTGIAGLPITPNGGDIIISWDTLGIFGL